MGGIGFVFSWATKLVNVSGKAASYGAKKGAQRLMADPKLTPNQVKDKLELMREFTKALPGEEQVSKVWIQNLIKAAKTPELKVIIEYLKSKKADNISIYERAILIKQCVEKMDLLKTMSELF